MSRITIDIPKESHRKLNKKTQAAIKNVEAGKGLVKTKNAADFFKKLGL